MCFADGLWEVFDFPSAVVREVKAKSIDFDLDVEDIPDIRRVIHIGPQCTVKAYFPEDWPRGK